MRSCRAMRCAHRPMVRAAPESVVKSIFAMRRYFGGMLADHPLGAIGTLTAASANKRVFICLPFLSDASAPGSGDIAITSKGFHLICLSERTLERFLTDLATKDVAASTENQAVSPKGPWHRHSENPNGIQPQSPGLPRSCAQGRGYPGLAFEKCSTPTGLCLNLESPMRSPREDRMEAQPGDFLTAAKRRLGLLWERGTCSSGLLFLNSPGRPK
jgi:hypothetical protein